MLDRDLADHFEAAMRKAAVYVRFQKEAEKAWASGHFYEHGETNNLFLAFREGVTYGASLSRNNDQAPDTSGGRQG